MVSNETLATPSANAEKSPDTLPHFDIPGFASLPENHQRQFLRIPVYLLPKALPLIREEIVDYQNIDAAEAPDKQEKRKALTGITHAKKDKKLAVEAQRVFGRAQRGEPEALAQLLDYQAALTGREPDADQVWDTVLASQSDNPFVSDVRLDEKSDDNRLVHLQRISDVFDEFRGDLVSVDEVLSPKVQIALFEKLSELESTIDEKITATRKTLVVLTKHSTIPLQTALTDLGFIRDGELVPHAIESWRIKQKN